MNNDDNAQQPITDDAELAKVLEGMNGSATTASSGLQFEEAPLPPPVTPTDDSATVTDDATDTTPPPAEPEELPAPVEIPTPPSVDPVEPTYTPSVATSADSGELDSIKKDALEELRPLVDRLNLPADEKFDTLLLIIRSTDDQSLLGAAHTAAKAIEDETRRAQALLDVIKEIDFFANQNK